MAYQARTVAQYSLDGDLIKRFPSAGNASLESGVFATSIIACCRGKHRQAKGYIWKYDPDYDIEGFYKDLYSKGGRTMKDHPNYIIFDDGKVYSKLSHRYLKPSVHRDGYFCVKLYDGEDKKEHFIHVLVARNFIPRVKGKKKVNHKDGVKTNNNANNLEWVTLKDNTDHAYNTGLIKKYNKPVDQYTTNGDYVKTYPSVKDAALELGVRKEHFSAVCNGKYKTCQGYIFKFQDEKKVKDNPKEEWKEIEGYPGYEISNLGRVYSQKTKQVRKLLNRKGRQTITIGRDSLQVHTLVATAFLEKPKTKKRLVVNHLDGNPHNNHIENLEWTTDKGNNEHALNTGLKKVRRVEQYTINGEYIQTYSDIKEAMLELNVSYTAVWNAASGKTKICQGYKLKFSE